MTRPTAGEPSLRTTYRTLRPSGRNHGHPMRRSPAPGLVTNARSGVPPDVDTRRTISPWTAANRMRPSAPHEPLYPTPPCTGQSTTGPAPFRSRRCSNPLEKKPIERPSGDQKSEAAPSVPGSGRASICESGRSQIRDVVSGLTPTHASCDPSGESANALPSTELARTVSAASATLNAVVAAAVAGAAGLRHVAQPATPAASASASAATSHATVDDDRPEPPAAACVAPRGVSASICRPTS